MLGFSKRVQFISANTEQISMPTLPLGLACMAVATGVEMDISPVQKPLHQRRMEITMAEILDYRQ